MYLHEQVKERNVEIFYVEMHFIRNASVEDTSII